MVQIRETLISMDVIEKKFCCDLSKCKGVCCIEGDSGAPLADNETDILEEEIDHIKPYMRPEGIDAVEQMGEWVIDIENDKVTPLINQKECAYVIFEDGIAKCAIEKAYFDNKTRFRKPVSCHLYPVRTKKYRDFEAVNYDVWSICKPALKHGEAEGLYVYQFLQESLIRKYGEAWYNELEIAADMLLNSEG
ncbi:MAG TPA: DUF3109 domain-containing protein [Bacteroidales bacterium]|nr:DUF3109 domain-containing protein [Bacteroidales bacterium]